jgi:hypothetical protein
VFEYLELAFVSPHQPCLALAGHGQNILGEDLQHVDLRPEGR